MNLITKYLPNTILVFLFAIVIYLSFELLKRNKEATNLIKEIAQYEYRLDKNKRKYGKEVFSDYQIMDNIYLTDIEGDSIQISQLLETPKFVYRFSCQSCFTCVEEDLKQIIQFGDIIGYQNIIIIADYENVRSLASIKNKYNIKSPIYIYKNRINLMVEAESESERATFYFIIDSTLCVKLVFLSESYTEFENLYLKRIEQYFLKNNL